MERVNYLIDSDVLIDYLRGVEEARGFLLELRKEHSFWISTINVMEVYSGEEIKNPGRHQVISEFLDSFKVIELNEKIAKRAGLIRVNTDSPFADAAIAATSLDYELVLVTFNEKHFKSIEGLELKVPDYER